MSEQFKFVVYDVIPLKYNVKLLLGVHDNVGLFTMFSHDEVVASGIRKGSTIVATEAVLVGEPESTYPKTIGGKTVNMPYKNPQQEMEIGGTWSLIAPTPQTNTNVSPRNFTSEVATETVSV